MLSPKRTKFRKAHKGRIHGNAKGGTQLNFGAYGLKAVTPERVTARQIEAARLREQVVERRTDVGVVGRQHAEVVGDGRGMPSPRSVHWQSWQQG